MSTIGTRLRELRRAKGLTQEALAGDGISAGYVSLIESGKRKPSVATTKRLAERLGVPLDQLLDGEQGQVTDEARLEMNFARMALANGNPAEAVRCLDGLSFESWDSRTASEAALVLAEGLQQTGQLDRAAATLEQLVDRCRREESWIALAVAAASLVMMYVEAGESERAVLIAEQAVSEVEAAGLEGTDEHIRLGATLVWACYERGDLLYATRRVEQLIKIADRVGTPRARGSIYWNASMVAHGRGRISDALQLSDRALALIGEQDDTRDLSRLRLHYAWLLLHRDAPMAVEALDQLDRAEADPTMVGARLDLGNLATMRGRAFLYLSQVDEAAECAAQALQLLGPSHHINRAEALMLLGDVGVAQFDQDLAHEAYRETARVLCDLKESRMVARLWRELGDAWRDAGEVQSSIGAYENSLRISGLRRRPVVRGAHQLVDH
jgi:transcriptional regulator with XRE-family HTH domain